MPKQRNAFRLGLTVILMVGLLMAVLLFLAGRNWGVRTQSITVRFAHSMSLPLLKAGATVYCGASQVGSVEEVYFGGVAPEADPAESESLYVYVHANVDATLGLRRDCLISAEGPLLGGTGTLVVRDRGVAAERLTADMVIEGRAAASIATITEQLSAQLDDQSPTSLISTIKTQFNPDDPASLLAKLSKSLDDVNAITAQLREEFDPHQSEVLLVKLHSILTNLNLATGLLKRELDAEQDAALMVDVHRAMDQINEGIGEAVAILKENRQPLNSTLVELESSVKLIHRDILVQLATEFNPDIEGTLLSGMHRALEQLNESLDNLGVVTGTVKEIVLLNRHNVNGALTNIRAASDYLKGTVKYLSAEPWLLLNPPSDKDSRERRTAEAAREFAHAASELEEALAQVRAVLELQGNQSRPDDPQLLAARSELEHARGNFGKAEAYFWEQVQAE